jgi:hypothetical protein
MSIESTTNTFTIKCYLVILSVDPVKLNNYILLDQNSNIPNFVLDHSLAKNVQKSTLETAANLLLINELELIPQLISFNTNNIINANDQELNIVYGFIIDYTTKINSSVIWQQFSYLEPNKYSNIIFEVSQKLR